VGWKVGNDGTDLAKAIGTCDSCSNFDLSYNGLGDKEGIALAAALKRNFERNRRVPAKHHPPADPLCPCGAVANHAQCRDSIHLRDGLC
jgi:hypothetical protein